jgi:type VI secretion system FHA domain protein
MTLGLTIVNVEQLENGVSTRLRLDRHGASIGRSPQADWSLPDPDRGISSSHCDIDYRDGVYVLTDHSTNGTYINGNPDRLAGPHRIADGDEILIGHYRILANLSGADAPSAIDTPATAPAWRGWDAHGGSAPAAAPATDDWGAAPPRSAISGAGAMSGHWAAPSVAAPPPSANSAWTTPAEPAHAASAWSSPVPSDAPPPSAADVWGQLAEGNAVDWSRSGLAHPIAAAPTAEAMGLAKADAWAPSAPPTPARQPTAVPSGAAPLRPAGASGEWAGFQAAAGLAPGAVKVDPAIALAAAGDLLRRLTAGMVVMLEARARAKAQLGAQGTSLEFEGNNPLKFARSPEAAIAQLLNPQERGFMPAERAVEDAFKDLQAHQMATLAAMQGALSATLARFSPSAIRQRAEGRGLFARLIPGAKEGALWKAYEQEFEGVARGSDEAFMDVFAKEFRQAYEKAAAEMKRQG